jgi:hypothetical protein
LSHPQLFACICTSLRALAASFMHVNALGPDTWGPTRVQILPCRKAIVETATLLPKILPRNTCDEWKMSMGERARVEDSEGISLTDHVLDTASFAAPEKTPYIAHKPCCMSTHDAQRGCPEYWNQPLAVRARPTEASRDPRSRL